MFDRIGPLFATTFYSEFKKNYYIEQNWKLIKMHLWPIKRGIMSICFLHIEIEIVH